MEECLRRRVRQRHGGNGEARHEQAIRFVRMGQVCAWCLTHHLPSTFMPQVARTIPPRPVTADDLERDRVLTQRIALFGWVGEKHLDIPEEEGSKGFLMFAQQGLYLISPDIDAISQTSPQSS